MKTKTCLRNSLLSFLLAGIAWILFLWVYGALGYGNNTILRGDLFAQYIDFISMFLRVLKGEESFWYSFSIFYGSGSVLTYAYYCLSPFNLLYLIEGISIPAMTTVIIGLKFSLAAATFSFFAGKVLKRGGVPVILFSLYYAFNTFSIAFYFNMVWLDTLYLLPIVILLLFELVDHDRIIGFTIVWIFMFVTNFYMSYMVGIFTALAFVALLILRYREKNYNPRILIRKIFLFSFSVLLAIGCCAVLLLPSAKFLLSHLADDNVAFEPLANTVFHLVNGFYIGVIPDTDNNVPLLYCGLPTLLLAPFYFFQKRFSLKERLLTAVLLFFLFLSTLFLPLFIFMHAFDYPNWYSYRFTFIISFILCAVACRCYDDSNEHVSAKIPYLIVALILFYSFMRAFWPLTANAGDVTNSAGGLAINALFMIVWYFILFRRPTLTRKSRLNRVLTFVTIPVLLAEITINGYLCMQHLGAVPLSESEYAQWYYPEKEAITRIKADDNDFYRISANMEYSSNAPSMFGYAGFNTFSTSDVYQLRNSLHSLGISTVNRAIQEFGYTPVTYMLFAQKYTLDMTLYIDSDQESASKEDYIPAVIQKNEYALPLGYMVSGDIASYAPGPDPFANQEQLVRLMTGSEHDFFIDIADSEIQKSSYNMLVNSSAEQLLFDREIYMIKDAYASFGVPVPEGLTYYACFTQDQPEARFSSPYVVGIKKGYQETPLLSYGCIMEGQPIPALFPEDYRAVSVVFNDNSTNGYFCSDHYAVYYDSRMLADAYDALSANPWEIHEFFSDDIKGTVTATEDKPVFFTSIPYEEGWHAYVDGQPVKVVSALNNAFLALVLSPGTHDVELRYIAPGSHSGAIITFISLLIGLLLLCIHLIRQFRSERIRSAG